MKKVLFATTALIATASVAAAEVKFSGYGRFGLGYLEDRTGTVDAIGGGEATGVETDETILVSRFRLNIDGIVETDGGVAFRGAFLIDPAGDVRAQLVNDLPLGRNIDELVRLVEALQFTDEHGEVCPAGWNKGDKGMDASPDGVAAYLSENAEAL